MLKPFIQRFWLSFHRKLFNNNNNKANKNNKDDETRKYNNCATKPGHSKTKRGAKKKNKLIYISCEFILLCVQQIKQNYSFHIISIRIAKSEAIWLTSFLLPPQPHLYSHTPILPFTQSHRSPKIQLRMPGNSNTKHTSAIQEETSKVFPFSPKNRMIDIWCCCRFYFRLPFTEPFKCVPTVFRKIFTFLGAYARVRQTFKS